MVAAKAVQNSTSVVDANVNSIVTNTYTWTDDPALLYQVREALARMASQSGPAVPSQTGPLGPTSSQIPSAIPPPPTGLTVR